MSECVQCGYCCSKAPCDFGKWNQEKHRCNYLTENNLCSKYAEIIKNPSQKWNPAFGYGCCMSLFNTVREEKIKNMIKEGK
jgi:predicted molibdopterin-dependent oxidoreductase YjgC